jgi:hypothetical protein
MPIVCPDERNEGKPRPQIDAESTTRAKPPASILKTGQPPPCVRNLGQAGVGVFLEVEELAIVIACPRPL